MESEYISKFENVVIWRPTGVLDADKIREFVNYLNEFSKNRDPHFHRFIDLTKISSIAVDYQDLYTVSESRKLFYDKHFTKEVKLVFYVNNPLTFGMTRMFDTLLNSELVDVLISESPDEIAQFLKMSKKDLGI